jgi:hypothetical protein
MEKLQELIRRYGVNGMLIICGAGMLLTTASLANEHDFLNKYSIPFYLIFSAGVALIMLGMMIRHRVFDESIYRIIRKNDKITITSAKIDDTNSKVHVVVDYVNEKKYQHYKCIALPVNSTFKDQCIKRETSSTGAYIKSYLGDINDDVYKKILELFKNACNSIGETVLVKDMFNKGDNVAFVAVTINGESGIRTNPFSISFASQELVRAIKRDNSITNISCPVFGSGDGGVPLLDAMYAMIDGLFAGFRIAGCNNFHITIFAYPPSIDSLDSLLIGLKEKYHA